MQFLHSLWQPHEKIVCQDRGLSVCKVFCIILVGQMSDNVVSFYMSIFLVSFVLIIASAACFLQRDPEQIEG